MTMHTCPRCGQPTEIPQLFPPMRQRIFTFIWNNPWCTNKEIIQAVYGHAIVNRRIVHAELSRMTKILLKHGYHLDRHLTDNNLFSRGQPKLYRIIYAKKGEENAPANVATVLR